MTPQKLLLAILFLFTVSCSSNSSDDPAAQVGDDSIPQVINDGSTDTRTISISLKGVKTEGTESQLVYRLYGHDPTLADVAATQVFMRVISLSSLPAIVTVEWPENAVSEIRPPVSNSENARFYLHLQVDLDMDGQICNGDLGQDYSLTDFFTLDDAPKETIEFYLEKIVRVTENCESYI